MNWKPSKAADAAAESEALGSLVDAYVGKLMPGVQVNTFRNTDRLICTRTVARGGQVSLLPCRKQQVRDMLIRSRDQEFDLCDYVSRNRVTGLLLLKDGEVALEHYEFGNNEHTRWLSMSVAKSVSTTLVGAAIHDGFISSVEDPLTKYLPQFAGTAYDGVSIRNLLQMTSGVQWDDTHTVPASERRRMLDLQIAQRPGEILRLLAQQPRCAQPGTLWNYSTGETHMVGAVLRAATGRWLADYLSEKIWSRLGMQADATWWLESPGGLEVAGSGLNATLRDYARFGLFMMNDGVIDGARVFPEGWRCQATTSRQIAGRQVDYGYMWWAVPDSEGSFKDGAFSARGIFGQFMYVNPAQRVVIVVWGARSKPKGAEAIIDNDFFNASVEALR
jgi:CubicO group peptidase (beta-lactamase class C family)